MLNKSLFWVSIGIIGLVGCKPEDPVRVYTAAKPKAIQAPKDPGNMAGPSLGQATAGIPTPIWETPSNWQAQPLGDIRKGSWKVIEKQAEVDISAMAFPGDVGGNLANVNRWRNQLSLEPWSEAQLKAKAREITIDGLPGLRIDLGFEEKASQAILAAIVPHSGYTWYFKMMGSPSLVESQRGSFERYLASIHFPAAL